MTSFSLPGYVAVLLCALLIGASPLNAEETFFTNMQKHEGKGDFASGQFFPSEDSARKIISADETPAAAPSSAGREETSPGFVIPHIAGSIAKELEETGMAVIHLEFALGRAEILPEHLPWIDEVQDVLTAHPDWKLLIEGHTDKSGRAGWNRKLSLLRAEAVRDELLKRGISSARLRCSGWGAERPVDTADNAEAYARNRRVELHRE